MDDNEQKGKRLFRIRTAVGVVASLRDKNGNPIRTIDAVIRTALRGGVLAALLILGGGKVAIWGDRMLSMLDRHMERQSAAIEKLSTTQVEETKKYLQAHAEFKDAVLQAIAERKPTPRPYIAKPVKP